ncbi:unnamed protein product [Adineta steineri]|uniref:F-box domain-containing protein n=1 Tax=Adineta steineri TaxID=433720 RepID=A0A814AC65_9BILA|nr:unnamed protein product [Adineta steineri]CAF3973921.1 unnamed protein product [Adineta steineri]
MHEVSVVYPLIMIQIMNNPLSRLECLPNEILMYIFQYFDARDLFRAFYNLNYHFNTLLQSLNYLSFTLLKYKSIEINDYIIFTSYIYTLTIYNTVDIDLNNFTNLHRLNLIQPTSNQLKQIVFSTLPYLEHLTIGYEHYLYIDYIPEICQKIFSNGFPCLKSCSLFEPRILDIISDLTQSTQITILKMDMIDMLTYTDILTLCPNLYCFQFTINHREQEEFNPIKLHFNLKQIIIRFQSLFHTFSDYTMNYYLSCVPNLEQLTINELNYGVNINDYLNYHWFARSIHTYLLKLHRFKYYLSILDIKNIKKENINHMKINFKHIHKNLYQSYLILN